MKAYRRLALFCTWAIITTTLNAQAIVAPVSQEQPLGKSFPIAGSHFLVKQDAEIAAYVKQHPDAIKRLGFMKTTAFSFTVGSTHSWYSVDFTTMTNMQVPSTCRAVGTSCYIFVEDASWTNGKVTQAAVDSVRIAFDQKTPANASKGIYQINVDAFGDPPNFDSDARIVILIQDIKDTYTPNGNSGYVAGYFYSLNETSQPQSNQAEILFIDCNPVDLTKSWGVEAAMSTVTHEFQHMIHFNYILGQITFINEGCSLIAEVNAGYSLYDQNGFINEANHYLFDWRDVSDPNVLKDYSRAARFSLYLRDQFGMALFKNILASRTIGVAGLDSGFVKTGSSLRFNDVLKNWLIANLVNDRTVDTSYGYLYPNVPAVNTQTFYSPNVPLKTGTVQVYAAEYLTFKGGSNLNATFTVPNGSSLIIKALEIGNSSKRLLNVTPGVQFSEPAFGTTYNEIHFVILNSTNSFAQSYSLQATGTVAAIEQRWDDNTEPTGYYPLTTSDTICVMFNAVTDGRLDSLRVALRRAGSIQGKIFEYSGNNPRPTPNGKLLASMTGTSTISIEPPYPYPIPYPNWVTVDLRSKEISSDKPLSVSFIVGATPTAPGIMVTQKAIAGPYHNYVYLHQPSSGTANWYYFANTNNDTIPVFLIRGYFSLMFSLYPGDANNDSLVDVRDLLPIGLYYGKTGSPRSGATTLWKKQLVAQTWNPTLASYADCDGNGVVDSNDVTAIIQNWNATVANGVPSGLLRSLICDELIREIDLQGASGSMISIRNAVIAFKNQNSKSIENIPERFELFQNYPNPFNPSTVIRYNLPNRVDRLRISIYNILGQLVWENVVTDVEAGQHQVKWSGETMTGAKAGSGIYFYRMTTGSLNDVKKMIFIK